MGKFIDITGQKFGRLIVLNRTEKRNACGQVYWNCLCECGNICEISGTALRTGHTKSCGCYSAEATAERNKTKLINLAGQKFGKLTVLYRDENHIKAGGEPVTMWHCKCDCGQETTVSGESLKRGNTKSCGCIKTSYGEDLIQSILLKNNIPFQKEYIFKDCILPSGKYGRFDFFIDNKYLVEFDGRQHFDPNAGWGHEKLKDIQQRDQIKNEYCKKQNLPLYRIPYTEVESLKTVEDILNKKYLIN